MSLVNITTLVSTNEGTNEVRRFANLIYNIY